MTDKPRAAEIRGKTIRLTWTEGPTKGTTHEHIFHEDGLLNGTLLINRRRPTHRKRSPNTLR